jgi:hypothetical protein
METTLTPIEQAFLDAAGASIAGLESQKWIEGYRVDFAVARKRLIIELDGHEYHSSRQQRTSDAIRQRALERAGYAVIRFTGTEIHNDVQRCVEETLERLNKLPDAPESFPTRDRVQYCIRMKEVMTHLLDKFGRDVDDSDYRLQLSLGKHFDDLFIERQDKLVTIAFFYVPAPGKRLPDPLVHLIAVKRGGEDFEEWAPIILRQLIPGRKFAHINDNDKVVIDDFNLQHQAAQFVENWAQILRLQGWPEKAVEVPWSV